jgi:YesN/AraC family two-component response regulator
MPGLSGIQLAKKVKEINPAVKTVLMTAFEIRDSEFSKVFPSTPVDGFVQKPIGIKELTYKILSLVGETKRRTDEGWEVKILRIEGEMGSESVSQWFNEEVGHGENGIIIYPTLQTFRQIYTKYAKEQLEKEDNNSNSIRNEQSRPRIILIATF